MKCLVCGAEFEGKGACPVCSFKSFLVVGEMPEELKEVMNEKIAIEREKHLNDIKVSLVGYHWEEKNGEIVEKSKEEFLIGEHLEKINIEEVMWGKTEYAQQTAGEKKEISVVVSNGSEKKQYNVTVVAPDTDSTWKAGVVLKPGFQVAIRIGNEESFSDSALIPLKG